MFGRVGKSFWLGLRRRWWPALIAALSALGSLWLLTSILSAVFVSFRTGLEVYQATYLGVVAAVAVIAFVSKAYEPSSVSFQLSGLDTIISVEFGDLFDRINDDLLIAVNEFFDGKLGQVVARESVHGAFIEQIFNSDESRFRAEIDRSISGQHAVQTARAIQPSLSYPVGTTAVLDIANRKAFLFVLSRTDLDTAKASATVADLWVGLYCALTSVHHHGNGRPFAMPLVGNGRSSINIHPQHLLRLVTLALVDFARKTGLPKQVTIVVPYACFDALDLREIARDWKKKP